MKPFKIDVPVAIIFFNRADTLQEVFSAVRKARPSKLFLIQDGARKDKVDEYEKVLACRKVVEEIDWECDVVRDYSDENLGCGKRVSSGLTNAFRKVDRLIILEDDCVPNQSMFSFCAEILERYKDDDRINMISGMNHLGTADFHGDSYCFCKTGAIWGWATWKRVWDLYEFEMSFFKDDYIMDIFRNSRFSKYYINNSIAVGQARQASLDKGERLTAWTYQFGMLRHLYSQMVVVPNKNLVSNIGLSDETTHSVSSLKMVPKGLQRVFFMETPEMEFPLRHPKYMMENTVYDKQLWNIMGDSGRVAFARKIESIARQIAFGGKGQFSTFIKKIGKKFRGK